MWAAASGSPERFIATQRVQFTENTSTKRAWLRIYIYADDVRRIGRSQNDVLQQSGLSGSFKKVKCAEQQNGRDLICLEQKTTTAFGRHGLDVAYTLAAAVKPHLWCTIGSSPPYRRYYLYLCPSSERADLIDQIASIYAVTFYLGSITRYRPTVFRDILDGEHGPRLAEFVVGQASQFIYLMASEFVQRDVTKPSIV
tara:strand:+ start:204 stop:797 length:594 start_codon:yes stop_codon:yes gene_type:complete